MNDLKSAVGQPLWDIVTAEFGDFVMADFFGIGIRFLIASRKPRVGFESIVDLISELTKEKPSIRGAKRLQLDLGVPLSKIKNIEISKVGKKTYTLDEFIREMVCYTCIDDLLSNCFGGSLSSDARQIDKVTQASGKSIKELSAILENNRVEFSHELLKLFWAQVGEKTLFEFYQCPIGEDGYRSWGANASTDVGRALKESRTQTSHGLVRVKVNSYENWVESNVRPYEWLAQLHCGEDTSGTPDAIACGMFYILNRVRGTVVSDASNLCWAADAVADTDVSQVLAYLDQHPAHTHDFSVGDLCFVWLWERKIGSPKGIGAECLRSALENLKKRFASLKIVIVTLQPSQFRYWGEKDEPAKVQVEKQLAIESLQAYVDRISPQSWLHRGALRYIMPRFLGANEMLAALGERDLGDLL